MRRCSLLFIISIFCWVNGRSQSDPTTLNAVVVTATRDSLPLQLANVAVGLMQKTDIRKLSSRSVPEMLQEQPGLFMQKTNHAGGSPFIRGLTGNQVLEMIDGIRLNNATFRYGPNQYLSSVDPFTVQSAEVLRNAYSTLYGSDAMGGIVNIITSEPRYSQNGKRIGGGISLKGMTGNMEKTASANIAFSNKSITWEAIGTFSDFGDAIAADKVKQTPTSYRQNAFHSKLKTRLSKNHELTFAYQYLRQDDVDFFDQVTQRGFLTNKIKVQERQLGYLRSRINLNNKTFRSLVTTLSGHYSNEERTRQKNNSPVVTDEQDKVMTYGLQMDLPMVFSNRWKGRSGIDLYHDKVRSQASDFNTSTGIVTEKRGLYSDGSTMTSFSLFHQQYYELDKWQFAGGLRLNLYNTKITDPSFGALRFNPAALAGNFSATYLFDPVWRLTASLNSAYRAPNINDLSSFGRFDFGVEVPSPSLKPERSLNKEILLQANYQRLSFAFAVFHNTLTDLIDRVRSSYEGDTLYMGERVYQKENIGNAVIYGFETYYQVDITSELQFQGHLTYTYGQNKTADKPLRRIPPIFTRVGLQYEKAGFFTVLNWTAAGEQSRLAPGDLSDHRINPIGTPGFGLLALRAGWRQGFFSLEGGLENILDQHYRYHGSGIDGYGRHFWLRTTLRF